MPEGDQQPDPGLAGAGFGLDAEGRGGLEEAVFDAADLVDAGLGDRRVDGFGLMEDLYPGAVFVDEDRDRLSRSERAARNNGIGLLALRVALALLAVGASVYGAFGTVWALRDASRSAAFDAAPACTAPAAPAGDCLAWRPQTVTGVHLTRRAGKTVYLTTVYLSGGQQLRYDGGTATAWVNSLTTGTTVSVLEWEGAAEALRQPDGVVLYVPNSTPLAIYHDTATAVTAFCFALLAGTALLVLSPLRSSRPRLTTVAAVLLGAMGVSGFPASITIAQATSFPAGIITGLAVYLSLTAAAFSGIAVWRSRRRRRAKRLRA